MKLQIVETRSHSVKLTATVLILDNIAVSFRRSAMVLRMICRYFKQFNAQGIQLTSCSDPRIVLKRELKGGEFDIDIGF